jgi:hypothetical protein
VARKKLSPDQAKSLAEEMRMRYPDASPREIMEMVYDPSLEGGRLALGDYYRGVFVPPQVRSASEAQQQSWKSAIDQRLYSQPLRERRREEAMSPSMRTRIADVVKPASMAASLTPFDAGLGDLGYAAGELIDPEGTYGDAALAAAGGALTGGVGSGALLAKGAKEARKGMKHAEDLIPTQVTRFGGPTVRGPTVKVPPFDPSLITKQSTRSVIPPELAIGVGGATAIGALGRENLRDVQSEPTWDYGRRFNQAAADAPIGVDTPMGRIGTPGYLRAKLDIPSRRLELAMPTTDMMNQVRSTTDYGNAFAEATERTGPSSFNSADDLSDVPVLYAEALNSAQRIYDQTGSIPTGMSRSLGKFESLMNTRDALMDIDSQMLETNLAYETQPVNIIEEELGE